MAEHGGGESKHYTVFIDTNLDTRLVTIVSDSDTVYDLKRKIVLEHRCCFPAIGDINVHCLKVKRRGNLYHLTDSMLVKSAFGAPKKDWFVMVEASRLEQDGDIRHMDRREAGNQLALPWVTNSQSIYRHDNHADRTSNLPLDCGSPSMRPIVAPFVNLKVPSTDQFTSGDSCKDGSKNIGEYRSANDDGWKNPKPDSEKQLDTKVQEELHTVNKEAKSKKRKHDVQNKSLVEDAAGSGPSVKKRRKSQRLEGNVKASEEDIVSKSDTGKLKHKAASIINESLCESKLESKDLSDENSRGENSSAPDQVATSVPSIVEDFQEETHSHKNTEAIETVPEVAMAVEKNIQQEMPFGISQMEKDTEFVQQAAVDNEIPSLSMSHLKAAEPSTKPKAAEKEVPSTSFSKELHNINKDFMDSSHKDVGSRGQESAVNQMDKPKKDRGEGKKRKSKKTAVKSKDDSLVKHADNFVGDISSTVPARVFDEKSIDARKNDRDTFSSAERNEVLQKTLIDDSFGYAAKEGDDFLVKEVEISEPTESMEERLRKQSNDTGGDIKTIEDVGRASLKIDESIVKHTSDAANVTNEEKLPPHFERKESVEMAYIDALPVDHGRNDDIMMDDDVEVSRTENNAKGVNANSEKQNEKMDAGTKKNKTKKKAKKSSGRSDNVAVVANEEKLLPQTEGNENREMTSIDALHIDHVRNDNILLNDDVELSRTEKNVSQVNAGGINDDLEKRNEKMDDGTKKNKKKKAIKSAGRREDAAVVANEEKLLPQTEGNENKEMTSIDALHIGHVRNDNILMNNDAELSITEKNVSQVNAGSVNDDLEKQNEKMDDGTKNKKKKKAKKSAGRSEDAAIVTIEEKLLPQTEGNEHMEMTSIDALHIDHVRNDNILLNDDVELSRTEKNVSQVNAGGVNDDLEKQNEKMDDGTTKNKKKKAKKSAGRSEDAAIVTTEEKLLPQTEGNEHMEMTLIDALHIDHVRNDNILLNDDVELSRTEKNESQVNAGGVNDDLEKQNEKMDDGTKKNKKKKAKKSAGRREDAAVVVNEEKLLPQTEGNENTEMTSIDALHIDHARNDNIIMNNDVELSRTEKNVSQVNAEGVNDELEKQNEKMDNGTKKNKKKKAKKSTGRSEDAAIVTTEEKLLPSSDIPKDNSREIDFKHYFVPHPQPENNAPTDIGKDAKLPGREKKTEGPSFVETSHDLQQSLVVRDNKQTREQDDGAIQASLSRKENNRAFLSSKNTSEVSNGVGKDQNTHNTDEVKTPKRTIKMDATRAKKTVQASKGSSGPSPELSPMSESFGRSFPNKKSNQQQSTLGHSHVNTPKKSAPVVKNLLNTPGAAIFGDDSDESSADDNATVGSDSSTRTPSRRSSSSEETDGDSSIDTRKNGSRVFAKRKDADGKSTMNSQSTVKKSMSDLLRSSSRFKRARFSASQQADDTESQPVDFVPESQL